MDLHSGNQALLVKQNGFRLEPILFIYKFFFIESLSAVL
jgi:hypothetical protein